MLEELGSIERHWDLETTLPLNRDRRTKMQTIIRELQVAIAERNLFASDVVVSEEVPAPWSAGNKLKLFHVLLPDN
uniref:Uncharacterized protein n=1 Tax=Chromera velia CCMP2878 TaxID=1169474 RepID=A0A0G4H9P0_9ALVE|eukprot:Cvel_25429.t1-p1 / transcript=Cvel_25429.t1 / gene=Cvel_25429 / organism=Chromera_velia_CCMP2878 / gene_product=hypothetical protein / transcript_product=hypothetical protein / location=Cvel_scaffold2880:8109-9769(-) / protein_length=75 / sequence_SO=supercontig / SO=protein_coding / is_pseudo=false